MHIVHRRKCRARHLLPLNNSHARTSLALHSMPHSTVAATGAAPHALYAAFGGDRAVKGAADCKAPNLSAHLVAPLVEDMWAGLGQHG